MEYNPQGKNPRKKTHRKTFSQENKTSVKLTIHFVQFIDLTF